MLLELARAVDVWVDDSVQLVANAAPLELASHTALHTVSSGSDVVSSRFERKAAAPVVAPVVAPPHAEKVSAASGARLGSKAAVSADVDEPLEGADTFSWSMAPPEATK